MEEKAHWFCFTYIGQGLDNGRDAHACVYVGYHHKHIIKKMINDNKANAGLTDTAVLIGCFSLGEMTKTEFLNIE